MQCETLRETTSQIDRIHTLRSSEKTTKSRDSLQFSLEILYLEFRLFFCFQRRQYPCALFDEPQRIFLCQYCRPKNWGKTKFLFQKNFDCIQSTSLPGYFNHLVTKMTFKNSRCVLCNVCILGPIGPQLGQPGR